ncbi:hypothetical protein N9W79_01450, partial [bacterium]|nr:hypothetical protein [bacterium]
TQWNIITNGGESFLKEVRVYHYPDADDPTDVTPTVTYAAGGAVAGVITSVTESYEYSHYHAKPSDFWNHELDGDYFRFFEALQSFPLIFDGKIKYYRGVYGAHVPLRLDRLVKDSLDKDLLNSSYSLAVNHC